MCGVVGYWHNNGKKAEQHVLVNMARKLTHRGPDDFGTWTHDAIGLGHTRLSILDLSSNGHQPFVTADLTGVIAYNGEIYNYRELRERLIKEGVSFKSTSDTEVLLYALHTWGPEQAVAQLDGMFAFVYYDLRARTLWMARDPSGIKPLYLIEKGNLKVFSSEIKALFEHPDIACRPDMHALTTQIIYMRLDGTWTPFEDVKCILPGSLLKINRAHTKVITYFDLIRDVDVDRILEAQSAPFTDLLETFAYKMTTSVKSHLVSDAPLATMCSGGLDSSLVTVLAKEHKPDLEAYVADVEGFRVDEAGKAQTVCEHAGIPLHKIPITEEIYLRAWPQAAYYNDQPNFFAQDIIAMVVSRAAYRDGFKVLLTGAGADELFGGYSWQVEAHDMWRLRRLHSRIIPHNRFFKRLGHYFSRLAPFDMNQLMKHPFTHVSDMSFLQSSDGLMSSVDGLQRRIRAEQLFQKLEKINPLEERAFLARAFEDFYTHLRTSLISNEKMGMAVSVEKRVPFLSNSLIDFGLHLNCRAKFQKKITKYIVKKFAEQKLPHEIVHAEKIGFGFTDHMWRNGVQFLQGGMLEDLFKWGNKEAAAVYEDLNRNRRHLFILMSMELWARVYLNQETPEDLSERLLSCLK